MSVNVYVIEDYENEPPSGSKKQTQTNPIQIARQKQKNGTFYPAHPTYIKEL
jgi:hypothetical protein